MTDHLAASESEVRADRSGPTPDVEGQSDPRGRTVRGVEHRPVDRQAIEIVAEGLDVVDRHCVVRGSDRLRVRTDPRAQSVALFVPGGLPSGSPMSTKVPDMVIEAAAPVRICDFGGWTDTWFGAPGRVVNIAVTPGVRVRLRETGDPGPVELHVATFGHHYRVVPGDASRSALHPLLEAAIDACPPPAEIGVEITVDSGVPAGCAAGTSAAVAMALLGALRAARAELRSPLEIAYEAHDLEVGVLGGESGIQDHLCVAFGGVNYFEIEPYPEATVVPLTGLERAREPADPGLPRACARLDSDPSQGHRRGDEPRSSDLRAIARRGSRRAGRSDGP